MEYMRNLRDKCRNYEFLDVMTIFMYIAMIVALYFAITCERQDLRCYGQKTRCKEGKVASIYGSKPKESDSPEKLLEKIRIASRHETSSVYWRRSLIFAIVIGFILLLLVNRRLPNGLELLITILILYLPLYLLFVYYQSHVSQHGVNRIRKATELLERKMK